jgi:hypothetical protein
MARPRLRHSSLSINQKLIFALSFFFQWQEVGPCHHYEPLSSHSFEKSQVGEGARGRPKKEIVTSSVVLTISNWVCIRDQTQNPTEQFRPLTPADFDVSIKLSSTVFQSVKTDAAVGNKSSDGVNIFFDRNGMTVSYLAFRSLLEDAHFTKEFMPALKARYDQELETTTGARATLPPTPQQQHQQPREQSLQPYYLPGQQQQQQHSYSSEFSNNTYYYGANRIPDPSISAPGPETRGSFDYMRASQEGYLMPPPPPPPPAGVQGYGPIHYSQQQQQHWQNSLPPAPASATGKNNKHYESKDRVVKKSFAAEAVAAALGLPGEESRREICDNSRDELEEGVVAKKKKASSIPLPLLGELDDDDDDDDDDDESNGLDTTQGTKTVYVNDGGSVGGDDDDDDDDNQNEEATGALATKEPYSSNGATDAAAAAAVGDCANEKTKKGGITRKNRQAKTSSGKRAEYGNNDDDNDDNSKNSKPSLQPTTPPQQIGSAYRGSLEHQLPATTQGLLPGGTRKRTIKK